MRCPKEHTQDAPPTNGNRFAQTLRFGAGGTPRVVTRRAAAPHEHTRSWQKELLIIGGSAGAGAGVGALTGGKKGAGIGAAAGGAGGLIYDLMTRKKP